jgi:hypothetical protein
MSEPGEELTKGEGRASLRCVQAVQTDLPKHSPVTETRQTHDISVTRQPREGGRKPFAVALLEYWQRSFGYRADSRRNGRYEYLSHALLVMIGVHFQGGEKQVQEGSLCA